jgi:hypothetical protein
MHQSWLCKPRINVREVLEHGGVTIPRSVQHVWSRRGDTLFVIVVLMSRHDATATSSVDSWHGSTEVATYVSTINSLNIMSIYASVPEVGAAKTHILREMYKLQRIRNRDYKKAIDTFPIYHRENSMPRVFS